MNREQVILRIDQLKPVFDILQTDTCALSGYLFGIIIISYDDFHPLLVIRADQFDVDGFGAFVNPVFDSILKQRLQDHIWNQPIATFLTDIFYENQFVAEPDFLNLQVEFDILDLLG